MAEKEQTPIQIFRERQGGIAPELKEYVKEQNTARKVIRNALGSGARTVPEIASESGLDSSAVMWHVMAMKRYGEVLEAGREGDYYTYQLKGDGR